MQLDKYHAQTATLARCRARADRKIVAGVLGLALLFSLGTVPAIASPNAGSDEGNPSIAPSSAPSETLLPPTAVPASEESVSQEPVAEEPEKVLPPDIPNPSGPGAHMGSGLSTSQSSISSTPPAARNLNTVPKSQTFATPIGLPGLDVSGWQADPATNYAVSQVNWASQWAMGARFVYTKATEGDYFVDASRTSHQKGASEVGMLRGSYHFALPSQSSAVSQANFFIKNGGTWTADGATLPPLLDIENNPYDDPTKQSYMGNSCYNMTPTAMVAWIKSFSNTVLAQTGRLPMIYTNYYWWQECTGGSKEFAHQALHIAAYGASSPWMPGGWKNYSFWQYSSTGPFAGDSNVWNGTLASLKAFARAYDAPVPTPSISSAADLIAADPSGVLWNYPATGKGSFGTPKKIGNGWTALRSIHAIDWDANGTLDLIAQWNSGRVSFYRGLPAGGFGPAETLAASGWGDYQMVIGYWLQSSAYPQILTRGATGNLQLWSNLSGSTLAAPRQIGNGWANINLTMVDFDGDGKQDLLAQQPSGSLLLYRSNGQGSFVWEERKTIGIGWDTLTSVSVYSGFTAPGAVGLIGRSKSGNLTYYPVLGNSRFGSTVNVGHGFASYLIAGGENINYLPPPITQPEPTPAPPSANPSIAAISDIITIDTSGKLWRSAFSAAALGTAEQIGFGFAGSKSHHVIDWNNDKIMDLLVQWTDGRLTLYVGNAPGGFTAQQLAGSGWASLEISTGQWIRGSNYPSILARNASGELSFYTTNNGSTLSVATPVATGLTRVHPVVTDFDNDGNADILGTDNIGRLNLYRSNGKGTLVTEPRPIVGVGWNGMTSISAAHADPETNSSNGLIARAKTGAVFFYPVTASKFGTPIQLATGWEDVLISGSSRLKEQQALASTGDVATADANGVLWIHGATTQGSYNSPYPVATGWKGVKSLHVTDWDGNEIPDVLAQWENGALSVYGGIRDGGFGTPVLLAANGWEDIRFVAGPWKGAALLPDLVGSNARGELFHWPNNGGKSLGAPKNIGIGWDTLTLAMQDFDSDQNSDLLVRDKSGTMYLYRGNGQGSFVSETRPVIGIGWGGFSQFSGINNFAGSESRGIRTHLPNGQVFYYPISGPRTWGTPVKLSQLMMGSAISF